MTTNPDFTESPCQHSSTSSDQASRRRFMRSLIGLGIASPVARAGSAAAMGLAGTMASGLASAKGMDSGRVNITDPRPGTPPQGSLLTDLKTAQARRLHLFNDHTRDHLNLPYYSFGTLMAENLTQLNYLMRDRRANRSCEMDPTLYDQLFLLTQVLETDRPVHVLSGYRTKATNAKLRKRSKRVAQYSLHIEGRAADIYVPGVPIKTLYQAAIELKAGGVGLYSSSNFIHIDTGTVRHWGS